MGLGKKLKYHLLAIIPTIAGVCIIVLGFYLLFIEAILSIDGAINAVREPSMLDREDVVDEIRQKSSPFIGLFLVVIGYITHRFGRKYILMRFEDSNNDDLSGSEKKPELMTDVDEYDD